MGQLDWGGRVQGEGKLTAGCPTVGLVPPGGLGRQCRRPGHQALTDREGIDVLQLLLLWFILACDFLCMYSTVSLSMCPLTELLSELLYRPASVLSCVCHVCFIRVFSRS